MASLLDCSSSFRVRGGLGSRRLFVEAGELDELIHRTRHQGAVLGGHQIQQALGGGLTVLLRELHRIDQSQSIQLQGCFAVGDDHVRPESTLRSLADVLHKGPAGGQGQLGIDLRVQITDLLEHKIGGARKLLVVLTGDGVLAVDGADHLQHRRGLKRLQR